MKEVSHEEKAMLTDGAQEPLIITPFGLGGDWFRDLWLKEEAS